MARSEMSSSVKSVQDASIRKASAEEPIITSQQAMKSEFNVRSTLALIGAFLALFCTLGFQNAFGVFQEYYARAILAGQSDFQISWIGSILTFLLFFCAAPAGILTDRIGPTPLLIAGCAGILLGTFMTSLCTKYYQFILAQGILTGASTAFVLTPAMATVSHMFDRHRSTATGIMIAGSSIGGIVWPIMLNQLLNHQGTSFGWSMRYVGFVVIPLAIIIVLTIRLPPKSDHTQSETEKAITDNDQAQQELKKKGEMDIVKNPTFLLLCGGLSVATLGIFTPFFFIPTYAVAHGLTPSLAFYLISILNGASLIGRVSTGILADRYGNFNLCFFTVASAGIIAMCWTTATSTVGIIFFTLAYGYTSGAMFSLQSPCAVQLASPEARGTAIGLLFVAPAIPGLVGAPIGGELIKKGYLAVSMYAGACLLAGSLLVLIARLRLSRKLFAKV